jgi:hypothetical protein
MPKPSKLEALIAQALGALAALGISMDGLSTRR